MISSAISLYYVSLSQIATNDLYARYLFDLWLKAFKPGLFYLLKCLIEL